MMYCVRYTRCVHLPVQSIEYFTLDELSDFLLFLEDMKGFYTLDFIVAVP